jgi:hypothetical protein
MINCFPDFVFKFNSRRYGMETLLAELEEAATAGKKVDIVLVGPGACCPSCHTMPMNSINHGCSKCVG